MQEKIEHETKRMRLLRTAITVFAKNGFDKTTVDDIAEAAHIAKGTVYYHFKSKEEVFIAIVGEGIEKFRSTVEEETASITDPTEKLEKFIRIQIAYTMEYRDFFKVLLSEWWNMESRWSQNTRTMQDTYFVMIETIVAQGQKTGVFNRTINTKAAAMSFFWLVSSATLNWTLYKQTFSQEELEKTLHTLILHALQPS